MTYTVAQILTYASTSQAYAIADIERKGLYGGGVDLELPRKIYCIRKNLQWIYTISSDDDSIKGTANYLIALCGKYFLKAANAGSGGGSVSPISPIILPAPIEFYVGASTLIPTGASSVTLNSFIGYNLLFIRNGYPQGQIDGGGTYFTWNKLLGQFSCIGNASDGEFFQLYPFL